MVKPVAIILISGKRKCGKDYISEKLCERITKEKCEIVRISEPIKGSYAKTHDLDLTQLMSDGAYKEKYRLDMIKWSENIRNEDYGYFCKIACDNAHSKQVWIVSDIRRKSDLRWFHENYKDLITTVRINADLDVRTERGWKFTEGVDDAESECDLDDIENWDIVKQNNTPKQGTEAIEFLYDYVSKHIA